MDLSVLHEIDEELTKSEVAAMKFLCMDHLGRKRLETMKDAKDLFLRLTEQGLLEDNLFLSDLLYTIGRYDLLSYLGTNCGNVKMMLQNQSSGVSEYRKMLYKLSEDITDENLHKVKFLLSNLPKAKLASATFLDVLSEMEKMEKLGEDNLDELENVLSKCSKELAYKVQKFKNRSGTGERGRISIPAQEENFGLSIPHQEESFSPSESQQDESISLANLSIAESHDPSISLSHSGSTPTDSLSGSDSTVDTDAQGVPDSEMAPRNTINVGDCYPVSRRPLGYCLIINNYNFEKSSLLNNRKGTDADRDSLTEVFERMHFIVEERRDLKGSDMQHIVKEFSEKDHSNMDAFVCCILSHGEKGTVLGIDGEPVQIRELTQPFALCSALTGKPKLFFIQACQGNELQKGMWRQDGAEEVKYEEDAKGTSLLRIPLEADFLIGMATVESYKSFRHTTTGSIYIQELCNYLKIGCPRKEDILSILTRVNHSVSIKELNSHKQMPEPRYTLTKKLVLPMD